jgi:hypothetical protein
VGSGDSVSTAGEQNHASILDPGPSGTALSSPVVSSPRQVFAGDPGNKDGSVKLVVPRALLEDQFRDMWHTKLGEFALLHGGPDGKECPDLRQAHALFQGLKRPLNHQGLDKSVHAYVTHPPFSYTFVDRTSAPLPTPKPKRSVFVVYAKFLPPDDPELQDAIGDLDPAGVVGLIPWWEWTFADISPSQPDDLPLPSNHKVRYVRRRW